MRRRLLLLNMILLALALTAAWQLRVRWREGQAEERRVLRPATKAIVVPAAVPARTPQPASAAAYGNVAQKMLFAQDRNPRVVVEVAPAKPMPALPVAYGMVDLGDGPVVILSEKSGAANRGYTAGEKIGSFLLAAIEDEELVFEWEGQQIRKKLQDLKAQPGAAPAAASGAASPAASSTTVRSVGAAPVETGPGAQLTGELKSCQPTDTSPSGTVRDGFRKVVTKTPFGMSCHWEPAK